MSSGRAVKSIAIAGAGPGGLYLAISLKLRNPALDVVVHERKAELNQTSNTYVTATIDAAGTQFVQREYTQDWERGRFTGWGDVDRIIRQLPDYRTPGGW